jgi:hypothetical protein
MSHSTYTRRPNNREDVYNFIGDSEDEAMSQTNGTTGETVAESPNQGDNSDDNSDNDSENDSDDGSDDDSDDNDDSEDDGEPPPRRQTQTARRGSSRPKVKRRKQDDFLVIHEGALSIKGAPAEMSGSFDRLARQVPDSITRAQKWMVQHRPPLEGLEDAKRLLPRLPLGDRWTAKDRTLAEKAWKNCPSREKQLTITGNSNVLALYKASLCVLGCFPQQTIGRRFNLEYDFG